MEYKQKSNVNNMTKKELQIEVERLEKINLEYLRKIAKLELEIPCGFSFSEQQKRMNQLTEENRILKTIQKQAEFIINKI